MRNIEQIQEFRRGCWREGLSQDCDLPDDFRGDVKHRALPRGIGLGERPRRLAREVAVGVRDHRPDGVEHLMQRLRFHRLAGLPDHGIRGVQERLVILRERAGLWQRVAEPLADHGERALRQITEVVRQIGVDARHDCVVAVVAVLPERDLAHEEIA